jgi:ABC-type multidrug transport system fused ATPase/permease subunit
LELIDYSDLELNVKVDEYDLSAISEGMQATVTIHALSKDVTGTVTEVSSVGTYTNGVTYFTATISIPQDGSVKVGMSAEAKVLKASATDVLTLPMSAIQYDSSDNPFVYMKQNGKLSTLDVTLGITDGTTVEIVSGLNENDTVFVPTAKWITAARDKIIQHRKHKFRQRRITMQDEILKMKDVVKYYHMEGEDVKALDQINLSICRGEFVSILGPSGSGKSTLMNILGCLDVPSSGEYILSGNDVFRLDENELAHIRNKEIGFVSNHFSCCQTHCA